MSQKVHKYERQGLDLIPMQVAMDVARWFSGLDLAEDVQVITQPQGTTLFGLTITVTRKNGKWTKDDLKPVWYPFTSWTKPPVVHSQEWFTCTEFDCVTNQPAGAVWRGLVRCRCCGQLYMVYNSGTPLQPTYMRPVTNEEAQEIQNGC